jgi:para-nitrobenzyl esterase
MTRTRQLRRWVALAGLVALGCETLSRSRGLAGTSWQLVEIQSMDGTTLKPDDSAKYTLAFAEGGKVSARADCNRGAGTWTSDGASQLTFGTFATTRAMCPPESLEPRFWRDLAFVRSYLVKDGKLHLSLMADGGIYVFAPLGAGGDSR